MADGQAVVDDAMVYVVDHDTASLSDLSDLLASVRIPLVACETADGFFDRFEPDRPGCTILEARLPQSSGLEVIARIRSLRASAPVILLSAHATVAMAVRAMQLGAAHVFEKPANQDLILATVQRCLDGDRATRRAERQCAEIRRRLATLSPRERQVMALVLRGLANKESARELGISPKAIEVHRANLMRKMAVRSAVVLARLVIGCPKATGGPETCAGQGCIQSGALVDAAIPAAVPPTIGTPAASVRVSPSGNVPMYSSVSTQVNQSKKT